MVPTVLDDGEPAGEHGDAIAAFTHPDIKLIVRPFHRYITVGIGNGVANLQKSLLSGQIVKAHPGFHGHLVADGAGADGSLDIILPTIKIIHSVIAGQGGVLDRGHGQVDGGGSVRIGQAVIDAEGKGVTAGIIGIGHEDDPVAIGIGDGGIGTGDGITGGGAGATGLIEETIVGQAGDLGGEFIAGRIPAAQGDGDVGILQLTVTMGRHPVVDGIHVGQGAGVGTSGVAGGGAAALIQFPVGDQSAFGTGQGAGGLVADIGDAPGAVPDAYLVDAAIGIAGLTVLDRTAADVQIVITGVGGHLKIAGGGLGGVLDAIDIDGHVGAVINTGDVVPLTIIHIGGTDQPGVGRTVATEHHLAQIGAVGTAHAADMEHIVVGTLGDDGAERGQRVGIPILAGDFDPGFDGDGAGDVQRRGVGDIDMIIGAIKIETAAKAGGRFLVFHGADVDGADGTGQSPLIAVGRIADGGVAGVGRRTAGAQGVGLHGAAIIGKGQQQRIGRRGVGTGDIAGGGAADAHPIGAADEIITETVDGTGSDAQIIGIGGTVGAPGILGNDRMVEIDGAAPGADTAAVAIAAVVIVGHIIGDGAVGDGEGGGVGDIDATPVGGGGIAGNGAAGQGDDGAGIGVESAAITGGNIVRNRAANQVDDAGGGKCATGAGGVAGNGAVINIDPGVGAEHHERPEIATGQGQAVEGAGGALGVKIENTRSAVAIEGDVGLAVAIDIPLDGDAFADGDQPAGQGDGAGAHAGGIESDVSAIFGIGDRLSQGAGAAVAGIGDDKMTLIGADIDPPVHGTEKSTLIGGFGTGIGGIAGVERRTVGWQGVGLRRSGIIRQGGQQRIHR